MVKQRYVVAVTNKVKAEVSVLCASNSYTECRLGYHIHSSHLFFIMYFEHTYFITSTVKNCYPKLYTTLYNTQDIYSLKTKKKHATLQFYEVIKACATYLTLTVALNQLSYSWIARMSRATFRYNVHSDHFTNYRVAVTVWTHLYRFILNKEFCFQSTINYMLFVKYEF